MKATHYLTTEQVSRRMGYTVRYVRKLCGAGEIRAERYGREWLTDPKFVDAWEVDRMRQKLRPAMQSALDTLAYGRPYHGRVFADRGRDGEILRAEIRFRQNWDTVTLRVATLSALLRLGHLKETEEGTERAPVYRLADSGQRAARKGVSR